MVSYGPESETGSYQVSLTVCPLFFSRVVWGSGCWTGWPSRCLSWWWHHSAMFPETQCQCWGHGSGVDRIVPENKKCPSLPSRSRLQWGAVYILQGKDINVSWRTEEQQLLLKADQSYSLWCWKLQVLHSNTDQPGEEHHCSTLCWWVMNTGDEIRGCIGKSG